MITIVHSKLDAVTKSGVFNNVSTVEQMVRNIIQYANKNYSLEDDKNNFKGAAFEIFGQALIKLNPNDIRIRCVDFDPVMENDMGVDGWGHNIISGNREWVAVQFKFNANHTYEYTWKDLGTFYAAATSMAENGRVERKGNYLFITTGDGINYKVKDMYPQTNVLGFKQLRVLVNGNELFWESLRSALTGVEKKTRILFTPKPFQQEIIDKASELLLSDKTRASINSACGSGKTFMSKCIAENYISSLKRPGIVIIAAPRLALLDQLINDYHKQKNLDYEVLKVGTGDPVLENNYVDDNILGVKSTTAQSVIEERIKNALHHKKNIFIFSTYHSVPRVGDSLHALNLWADLAICDEAHNTVADNDNGRFSHILYDASVPCRKRLFFTATPKHSSSNKGVGMQNESIYGPVIAEIEAKTLSDEGHLCPPLMCFVSDNNFDGQLINTNFSNEHNNIIKVIITAFKEHREASILRNLINGMSPEEAQSCAEVRFIITCESADAAHDLAEDPNLKHFLGDISINAVTTKANRMPANSDRTKIFREFQQSNLSILFHYDIVSEGIDLPNTTAVMFLRNTNTNKTIQIIGRALRLHPIDRARLDNKEIPTKTENPKWYHERHKPFGYVVIPYFSNLDDTNENIKKVVKGLRSLGYKPHEMINEDRAKGSADKIVEFISPFSEESTLKTYVDLDDTILEEIKHIYEEIEEEVVKENRDNINYINTEAIENISPEDIMRIMSIPIKNKRR